MLSCGQRIGNAKLFIPNLEKKTLEKVLGAYFPHIVIVWGNLRVGALSGVRAAA